MVRAKFKCTEKTLTADGAKIKMEPVTCGSTENDNFFKWTPWGNAEIGTLNADAAAEFEPGKEYYIDFSKAEN